MLQQQLLIATQEERATVDIDELRAVLLFVLPLVRVAIRDTIFEHIFTLSKIASIYLSQIAKKKYNSRDHTHSCCPYIASSRLTTASLQASLRSTGRGREK